MSAVGEAAGERRDQRAAQAGEPEQADHPSPYHAEPDTPSAQALALLSRIAADESGRLSAGSDSVPVTGGRTEFDEPW